MPFRGSISMKRAQHFSCYSDNQFDLTETQGDTIIYQDTRNKTFIKYFLKTWK